MFAQEQLFLKAEAQFEDLQDFVKAASENGLRIDEIERGLFHKLLALGYTMLEAHVQQAGDGDLGETVKIDEDRQVRRLPQPHARRYLSIFGELTIDRYVYGTREGQRIEFVPLDEKLGLPDGEFSYVLSDWLQRLCVKESFQEATCSLKTLLGLKPSVRSSEHMNQHMAEFVEGFQEQRAAPPLEEEGEVLVVTGDGKGVPMRRPPVEKAAGKRRKKGEKANKKQMAYVGAVYSIDRFCRTADDIIDDILRKDRASERPRPLHKRVRAEMTHVIEGEACNGRVVLFGKLAEEARQRNPTVDKPVVCLMDGERALWEVQRYFLPHAVCILDLFHVLERLWTAAYCFHPEGSRAAEDFVEARLRMLLEGKVGRVIGGFRQMLSKRELSSAKRKKLQSVITYYQNNRDRMCYDEYLSEGYPIGSGVAEGACRHLVKDRMEQTGMRWSLNGAQSMVNLRATYLNNDWDEFMNYYIQHEQKKLYRTTRCTQSA